MRTASAVLGIDVKHNINCESPAQNEELFTCKVPRINRNFDEQQKEAHHGFRDRYDKGERPCTGSKLTTHCWSEEPTMKVVWFQLIARIHLDRDEQ